MIMSVVRAAPKPDEGCSTAVENFEFPTHKRIYYINHHRPADIDIDDPIYESQASNKNNKKLGIVCALKKGMSPDPGYQKKKSNSRKK